MRFNLPPKLILATSLLFAGQILFAQDTTKAAVPQAGQTTAAKEQDSSKLVSAKTDTAKPAPKPQNTLTISAELRTRAEFRHGYRQLYPINGANDTTPAFFIAQRTRLNFAYATKRFDLYASLQDVRIWGEQDPREGHSAVSQSDTTTAGLYLFEIYAEPHFNDKWSVRIGRQRIIYDNQRLFAENDWRNVANSHDAVRFIYNNRINFTMELTAAFNQSGENVFTTNYKTRGFINYKDLFIHYLNWKMSPSFILTTINSADGYQSSKPGDYKTTNMRFTSGGRLEFTSYNWYLTFSGYYQYGKDSAGKKLSAYYMQPEIKYSGRYLTIKLGAQFMSGTDIAKTTTKDNSFVPLYGTAHSFNGNLDFFNTFQSDMSNTGLVNPYLYFWWIKNKWTIRMENHLLYADAPYIYKTTNETINKYLGFENDWRIFYKVNNFITIEYGAAWAKVTRSMTIIKNPKTTNPDNYSKTPYWTYLSLKFTPTIGKFSF